MIRSLQSRGVFCCGCTVQPDGIQVAIYMTDGSQVGNRDLVDLDTNDRYTVQLPRITESPTYKIFLPYAPALQNA